MEENKKEAITRLDFMINKGYIDINNWNDEHEFHIITQAYEMWKTQEI